MENKYDVLIIGAGNGGLVAALNLVKRGKKVLILEKEGKPGGMATSFVRGRFEFETSLYALGDYGTKSNPGSIYKLFEKLGIDDKLEFVTVPEAFHLYAMDENVNYKFPFGIIEFIEKMEEYVPKSSESLKKFFFLAEECKEALAYLEESKDYVDQSYMKKNFPDFLKVSTHTVDKVLDSLKMPRRAQEILTTYWVYLGSPSSKLSFVHYASMFFSYISKGAQIPYKKSYGITLALTEEILKLGGEIKYFSPVKEILFKDKKVAGVLLESGDIFEANHIISNISPTVLYGEMVPSPIVPKEAVQLLNSRVLGARGFSIFLGLNQSAKDLGLEDYSYFICENLNSDKEYQNRSSIKNGSSTVYVLNNAIPSISPKGTCIVEFKSLFMGDVFSKHVTEKNYFDMKSKIANNLIDAFEKTTGIVIKPYIEEIEIATPVTFSRYGGYPDGVIYGYKATGMDNMLPRMIGMDRENYIPNLRFCGGFDVKLVGYSASYLSGDLASKLTLKDMKGEVE